MDCSTVLGAIAWKVGPHGGPGTVVHDTPALARVPAGQLGMVVRTVAGASAAAEFVFRIGLPFKSGVGGDILAHSGISVS